MDWDESVLEATSLPTKLQHIATLYMYDGRMGLVENISS